MSLTATVSDVELRTAMGHIGLSEDDQEHTCKLLASLLHIGNIRFTGEDEAAVGRAVGGGDVRAVRHLRVDAAEPPAEWTRERRPLHVVAEVLHRAAREDERRCIIDFEELKEDVVHARLEEEALGEMAYTPIGERSRPWWKRWVSRPCGRGTRASCLWSGVAPARCRSRRREGGVGRSLRGSVSRALDVV